MVETISSRLELHEMHMSKLNMREVYAQQQALLADLHHSEEDVSSLSKESQDLLLQHKDPQPKERTLHDYRLQTYFTEDEEGNRHYVTTNLPPCPKADAPVVFVKKETQMEKIVYL
jgi:hypothetical protein